MRGQAPTHCRAQRGRERDRHRERERERARERWWMMRKEMGSEDF